MSEVQLAAFFEAVKADAGLEEKLKAAGDLDAAVAIAKEAGFEVSKAEWLKAQVYGGRSARIGMEIQDALVQFSSRSGKSGDRVL